MAHGPIIIKSHLRIFVLAKKQTTPITTKFLSVYDTNVNLGKTPFFYFSF